MITHMPLGEPVAGADVPRIVVGGRVGRDFLARQHFGLSGRGRSSRRVWLAGVERTT